jgi:hypothetical protein
MKILSGKALPRRTFLKGAGAVAALPYLDAMMPAVGAAAKKAAAAEAKPTRFVAVEVVHGSAGSNAYGASKYFWAPQGTGRDFQFVAESALKPMEKFRDYLTIISNTDVHMADPIGSTGEIGGDHFRSSAVFLTQAHPKQTNGSDLYAGTSFDQVIAKRIGQDSPMPSIQLCIENLDQAGGCDYNYSCAYTDTISWSSPRDPLPMIRDPRVAFDMLFGAGANNADRAVRRAQKSSVLDWVLAQSADLKKTLGPTDRQRVDAYFENVRELERRIQKVEARNSSGDARAIPEAPPGVPDSFTEHMHLMFAFQALALQTDMTRVIAFKTGRDASVRVYTDAEPGAQAAFHNASHYGASGPAVDKFNLINKYYMSLMADFTDLLKNTQDGDSNLLETSLVMYGSPMGDSNLHNHRRCPLIAIGHANGKLAGNMHIKAPDQTPMANAFVSLAHVMGHTDITQFGDSTEALPLSG